MIIGLSEDTSKIELYELVQILRKRGADAHSEQAGGGVEIVRAQKNGMNVTAGPFCNGYVFSDEVYYGDDGINEIGDYWGWDEGTAEDLADDMMKCLND